MNFPATYYAYLRSAQRFHERQALYDARNVTPETFSWYIQVALLPELTSLRTLKRLEAGSKKIKIGDEEYLYEGETYCGEAYGSGIARSTTSKRSYEGTFKNDKPHGIVTFRNAAIQKGDNGLVAEFKDGELFGKATDYTPTLTRNELHCKNNDEIPKAL